MVMIAAPKNAFDAPTRLKEHFPAPSFYPHQEATLDKIEAEILSGKKYVFLEAPTGAGKSFLGMAIARWLTSFQGERDEEGQRARHAHLVTIQKILQDQYNRDFPPPEMETLKGRGTYECEWPGLAANAEIDDLLGITTCDVAPCKIKGEGYFKECLIDKICSYYNAIEAAQAGPIVNFNFQSWLFNNIFTDRFAYRKRVLILDECHNVEQELMRFVSFTVSDGEMPFKLPNLDTAQEYISFLDANSYTEQLSAKAVEAKNKQKIKRYNYWTNRLRGYATVRHLVKDDAFIAEDVKQNSKGERSVELKPLFVRRFFPRYFQADVVLLMSATILNMPIVAENLGLDPEQCAFVRMPSTFPKEHRPVYFNPVGPMTFKYVKETTPRMIAAVDHYLRHYHDKRGIIHCHSFRLGDAIYNGLSMDQQSRIIYQKSPEIARAADPRMEVLRKLAESQNGVILAPAFHEGVDLKDDLSRFQLICKVPYPDVKSSKQLAERAKDFRYYLWLTALKTVQSVGRSVRSPSDHAITHVLDEDFQKFLNRTRNMLPEWFTEAIIFPSA